MTDTINNDPVVNQDPPVDNQDVKPDAVNPDDKNDPRNNPLYGRVSDLSAKNKDLKEQIAKTESDREKVRKAELEKQGEYKTLLEEANTKIDSLTTERDTAVDKWSAFETSERETLVKDLSDEDKAIAMKLELPDMKAFVTRIAGKEISTSTDTRRTANHVEPGKIKPMSQSTDKENRDNHAARIAQYET